MKHDSKNQKIKTNNKTIKEDTIKPKKHILKDNDFEKRVKTFKKSINLKTTITI
jgi:hypothetical protein